MGSSLEGGGSRRITKTQIKTTANNGGFYYISLTYTSIWLRFKPPRGWFDFPVVSRLFPRFPDCVIPM